MNCVVHHDRRHMESEARAERGGVARDAPRCGLGAGKPDNASAIHREVPNMVPMPLKVLLAEERAQAHDLIERIISTADSPSLEVDWARDFESCLGSLDQREYQVLLIDLDLPGAEGTDAIGRVRRRFHRLPIVAMAGQEEEGLEKRALKAGAQGFLLAEELNPAFLCRAIRCAMDRRELEMELERHTRELEELVAQRNRQLQAAHDQWERTFNALPDLIAILDKEFTIVKANAAMAEAVGSTPAQLVGRRCFEVMHNTNAPVDRCPHAQLLGDGAEHVEEIHECTLGCDLLVSTSPIFDDDGELIGSVHVARDINKLKNAQRAVAESERLYRTFMDNLPDPTVVYDQSGAAIYANAAFNRVFGWSMEDIAGQKVDFVPSQEMPETIAKVKQMMRGEVVVDFETKRKTKDGRVLSVMVNTAPFFDLAGNQNGNIVMLRDITARHRAEAARRESEEKFKELVESMNEGLAMIDCNRKIIFANERYHQMLDYPNGGLLGKTNDELLEENSLASFRARWKNRVNKSDETKYESVFLTSKGKPVPTLVSPKILRDGEGNITGSLAVITDLTEQKQLESRLIQAQKLEGIGQLAAGIAHEINTPTQYVLSNTGFLETSFGDLMQLMEAHRGFAATAAERELLPEQVDDLANLAEELDLEFLAEEIPKALSANRDGMERISKIVLSIKEFSHPGQEDMQPADLNKAIENTVIVASNEWKYVAEMDLDLDPDLPPVDCIIGEINQVILNLIVNAAQAMGEGTEEGEGPKGIISISTRQHGELAEIRVSDNGPGIPKAILGRVFDPFFTTKDPGKGTGQGLSLAYRAIVKNHNGDIAVDSREGEHTTFTIRIPLDGGAED